MILRFIEDSTPYNVGNIIIIMCTIMAQSGSFFDMIVNREIF